MNAQEAEVAICDIIARIDEARATLTPEEAAAKIALLEAGVADLRKIAGLRGVTGSGEFTLPMPK